MNIKNINVIKFIELKENIGIKMINSISKKINKIIILMKLIGIGIFLLFKLLNPHSIEFNE